MKYTFNQHRGQAFAASRAIEDAAARIAALQGISIEDAIKQVFQDQELLAKCHAAAPRMRDIQATWTDPNDEPQK